MRPFGYAQGDRCGLEFLWAAWYNEGEKILEDAFMESYSIIYQPTPDWDTVPAVELQNTGWLGETSVRAWAQLCRDDRALWVRMEAEESPVRATLTEPLDPICCDSCLEFFLAPDPADSRYLNFEFNPLGNVYLGFGSTRPTRVRQIVGDKDALFRPAPFFTEKGWGIVYCIPFDFIRNYFPDFRPEGDFAGNFYKCGDETERPHYLSWMKMHTDTPDFHRRGDFGVLRFV